MRNKEIISSEGFALQMAKEIKVFLDDGWSINIARRKVGITPEMHTILLKNEVYKSVVGAKKYKPTNLSFLSLASDD